MQLDADEDGEPFFRPPIIAPSPLPSLNQQQPPQQQEEEPQSRNPTIVEPGGENERPQVSAATATVEQEE